VFRIVECLPGVPMARAKPQRSGRTGRFEAASVLDDAGFLGAVCGYVRGVDQLAPLLQFMLSRLPEPSSEWRHLKAVSVMLDGMASAMAGQLVERGERLMFGRPPSVDLIAAAFEHVHGDDNHDALDLCVHWCWAVDDVLWFLESVGVAGSKRQQKLIGDALGGADPDDAVTTMALYAVRDAVAGLRARMVERLSAASDRHYLGESKKPKFRLQAPVHRLLGAGASGRAQ